MEIGAAKDEDCVHLLYNVIQRVLNTGGGVLCVRALHKFTSVRNKMPQITSQRSTCTETPTRNKRHKIQNLQESTKVSGEKITFKHSQLFFFLNFNKTL